MKTITILSAALVFLTATVARTQVFDTTGRWADLTYSGGDTTPDLFTYPPTSVFIRDTATLFIRHSHQTDYFQNNLPVIGAYKSIDTGHTWVYEAGVHTPHQLFPDGVAISKDGFISRDSARTWQRLNPPFPVEPIIAPLKDTVRQAMAYSSNVIVCLYGPSSVMLRLCYTLDGAKTWQFPDVSHWDTTGGYAKLVQDSSIIGKFPSEVYQPSNNPYVSTWGTLLGFADSTRLHVITYPVYQGYNLAEGAATHYMATVNLFQRTGSLQFIDTVIANDDALYTLQWTNTRTGYLIQNDGYSFGQIFHRTTDGGQLWEKMTLPNRYVRTSLRFYSQNYGAGANGFTRDGGKTWQYWNHPWHDPRNITGLPLTIALDSAKHLLFQASLYRLAKLQQVIKRSYDAGRTWVPTRPSPQAWSVAANSGRVVVGRGFRSLMLSTDHGSAWRDIGFEGALPPQTSCVWGLAFPDTAHDPLRVVGLATMITYDNRRYVAMIESSDGGQSWREGMVFPDRMDSLIRKYTTRPVAQGAANFLFQQGASPTQTGFLYGYFGLYATTDAGATWQLRTPNEVRWLSMRDSLNGLVVNVNASGDLGRTTDGGLSWTSIPDLVPALYVGVQYLPKGMYRAVSIDPFPPGGGYRHFVHSSDDDGLSWQTQAYRTSQPIIGGTSAGTSLYWIDSGQVYKFDGSYLSFSDNGAKSFTYYLQPGNVARYLSNDDGIWPASAISGGYYYVIGRADTLGRWRIDEKSRSGVRDQQSGDVETAVQCWPNPTSTRLTIATTPGTIINSAELYNVLGLCVARQKDVHSDNVSLSTLGLPAGAYRVVLRFSDGRIASTSVVVGR